MIVVVWVVFSADARQKQTRGQAACAERDQVQQELQQWEATVLAVGRGWKILYIYIYMALPGQSLRRRPRPTNSGGSFAVGIGHQLPSKGRPSMTL